MIHTLAINKHNEIRTNLPIEEILEGDFQWSWIDFDQPIDDEIEKLHHPFRFHPLSIEDCLHNLQRPKIDYFETYTFFVTHCLNPKTIKKDELNIFLGKNFIVTFHHHASIEVNAVKEMLTREDVATWTQYTVLYQLLDHLVDNYFPIVYDIEDSLAEIDENPTKKTMEALLDELFSTRHQLLSLRHTVVPMKDIVHQMINSEKIAALLTKKEYYSDIYDHLLKISELVESNRELTTDIRDSYLSYNSHHSNRIMQILTVITTIFMPLSFLAGLYGMNFVNMPELQWKYGYFLLLFIMASIGIGMFILFKRKGWFK
ncbi:magnesium/cobalt transporter CorA [Cytobacillus oceanisediminis]|uniref:Magnesium transport protein CorA n=1 Tax=Niallia alba TaxID=2729105 RepID=A0A7Y0K7J6_9BACI|nr:MULTISPECIES: magnesium/cobalt transporter CorA [Bacillaceae]EOR25139.1 magnesium and cobalt transport protein CorA [Niallia nealsonii AAU1]MBQ6446378.1 magnesium/cobalt transporter CorA [Bacillus sp. (in: firmicutes)]MBZ9535582.1 magnesium/cobalt transporter CorA [Cytobacillus oceanisediminis]NMO76629.1 magnesium/cobalt transporter CorA [Niallia alba]